MTRRDLVSAGTWLALSGPPSAESEMILLPRGVAVVGTSDGEIDRIAAAWHVHASWLAPERPRREITVGPFQIDRFPVTHAEYLRFCRATGRDWPLADSPAPPNVPATRVSAADAEAYATWAGKRLPSETEWEFAARGMDGLMYPWGDRWVPGHCNSNAKNVPRGKGIAPVDAHPFDASPFGVRDMAGNVCEWTSTAYLSSATRVVKGGFWRQHEPYRFRVACRLMSQWGVNRQDYIGFRCARDAKG
jgi:formylglycine-generating enzyme required for sulfatase activity